MKKLRQMQPGLALAGICGLFGKTRQAYYEAGHSERSQLAEQAVIVTLVEELRVNMPRLGTRKLFHELKEPLAKHGIEIGRDRLFDLLAGLGMLVRRRKRRARTTFSDHPMRKYPNLVKGFVPDTAEQLWVSDITYIAVGEGFSYLSLITDAYSRMIVGYFLSTNLKVDGCVAALTMALETRKNPERKLTHHSDRGFQYCWPTYINLLNANSIAISMTQTGDPKDNAQAERVNGILKTEFGLKKRFADHEQAKVAVAKSVAVYNNQRPHLSCDYLKPAQAHLLSGLLKKHWKTYYRKAGKEVQPP